MTSQTAVPLWIRPWGRIWHVVQGQNSGWSGFLCGTLTPNAAGESRGVPGGPKCRKCMDRLETAVLSKPPTLETSERDAHGR